MTAAPPPPPAASPARRGGGFVSELKARLGDSFGLLQTVSIRYQRGEVAAGEYYELSLDILQGDVASLMRLVDRLPDAAKREAVQQCYEQAMAELEEQLLLEDQLAAIALAAAAKAAPPSSRGREVRSALAAVSGAAAAAAAVHGNICADEDTQGELDGQSIMGQSGTSRMGGGGGGDSSVNLAGNRLWVNADGEQLGQAIRQFMPPWDEAAALQTQAGRQGSYRQLAAARRLASTSSAAAAGAAVPSSTPWLQPEPSSSSSSAAAPASGASAGVDAGARPMQTCLADLASSPRRGATAAGTSGGSGGGGRGGPTSSLANSSGSGAGPTWPRPLPPPLAAAAQESPPQAAPRPSTGPPGARAPVVVWCRRDLRLADNPALHHAATSGRPVLPVFIWAPQEFGRWPPGGAAQYWLHHSLASLDADLQRRYGTAARLRCYDARGSSSAQVLEALVQKTGAALVVWNRMYEPWCLARDAQVKLALGQQQQCQQAQRRFLAYHLNPGCSSGGVGGASNGSTRQGAASPAVSVRTFNGSLLFEPWDVAPDQQDNSAWSGGYGSVGFFLGSCTQLGEPSAPLPAPDRLIPFPAATASACQLGSCSLAALELAGLPVVGPQQAQRTGRPAGTADWAAGIRQTWQFGEAGGRAALEEFLECGLDHFDTRSTAKNIQSQRYEEEGPASQAGSSSAGGAGRGRGRTAGRPPAPPNERFRADKRYTARISPYMAWGELSPRQVYHAALDRHGPRRSKTFLRRLAWRDLAYWALWRFPWMPEEPLRPQYGAQHWDVWWRGEVELASLHSRFRRWQPDDPRLLAWQRGLTGFPLVDAGMRELWTTGYCCNYVRHIVAGFLIEYLNIDWRHGCLWFHDTLCDADVAINSMMWQNGGHSGFDQWNFVMHPVFAAKAADPEGDYVRRWCPELARLAVPFIHAPWEAPATTLAAAGVTVGRHYPRRIITDLDAARRASLAAVVDMRRSPAGRKYVLPDGQDALPLPDGRFARAITRVDYRQMAEQPVTKQAAADLWDKGRRPLRDPMAVAMQDTLRGSLQKAAKGRGGSAMG